MWSYYAEGHRGISVRFGTDVSRLERFFRSFDLRGVSAAVFKVQYSEEFPKVNYYKTPNMERLKAVLGTKAAAWKHEEEWRIVLPNRSGYFPIPPGTVTGIIFGMRTPPEHEKTIRNWVVRREPAIELLRVCHKPGSFLLELVPA